MKSNNKAKNAVIGLLLSTNLVFGVFVVAKATQINKLFGVFNSKATSAKSGKLTPTRQSPLPTPNLGEAKLTACYESFLGRKHSRDEGAVVVSWTVQPDGNVDVLKLVQTDLKDDAFNNCILDTLKKVHYTKALDHKQIVSHKFNFKRRDREPASIE
jgi:hypothetical protein